MIAVGSGGAAGAGAPPEGTHAYDTMSGFIPLMINNNNALRPSVYYALM